jgi:GntR family transcriptional regulator/MocR family aminotransferase
LCGARDDHYHAGVPREPAPAPPGIVPVLAIDRAAAKPIYRQIYDGYREAIVERRLRPGQRLPSTRSLAAELQVSRLPVLTAFEQLLAEGYFEARVGAGTFVASSLPEEPLPAAGRPEPSRVAPRRPEPEPWLRGWGAFRVSQPAVERFPFAVWSSLVARHTRDPRPSLLLYGDAMGSRPFREAIAGYLRTARGVRCDPEQIMVVSGSQQALDIAARALLDAGSPVWVEDPGYSGVREALSRAGARLVPVPVDGEGLDVAAGITLCAEACAAYVTPSHQYPLGVTMSASRRLQLLDWARRTGAWILEDDYDSEYRYGTLPIASLQGLDRGSRVLYVGTFSKVLFPALRLGYLVIPAELVARFAAVRDAMDIFPPALPQAALTDFITEGHFGRHLRRMRQLYRERRSALVNTLSEELRVLGDPAGLHLTALLPEGTDDRRIAEEAARHGVWAMPLSACYLGAETRQGLVLGFGGVAEPEIREGARRLHAAIK